MACSITFMTADLFWSLAVLALYLVGKVSWLYRAILETFGSRTRTVIQADLVLNSMSMQRGPSCLTGMIPRFDAKTNGDFWCRQKHLRELV